MMKWKGQGQMQLWPTRWVLSVRTACL